MNNDLGVRYLATGDLLDQQVRQGQMTSAEAKARLAVELSTANTEYERRKAVSRPSVTNCRQTATGVTCTSY